MTRGEIGVLDEVLGKKAGAKPKLVTPAGGVGSGVRHLSQDELDAYVNGRLPAARLDSCSDHLDSCDACRAELEDLRTFKSNAAGLSQSGSLGRELDRRKRQRQLKAAGSAAMVAAVVAALAAVGWWQFGKARAQRTSKATTAVTTGAQQPAQPLTGGALRARTASEAQSHDSGPLATVAQVPAHIGSSASQSHSTLAPSNQLAGSGHERTALTARPQVATQPVAQSPAATATATPPRIATQPASVAAAVTAVSSRAAGQPASAAMVATATSTQPASATMVATATSTQPASAAMAATATSTQPASAAKATTSASPRVSAGATTPAAAAASPASTFALLGPFGDEIADARPEFAWQPLAGATKYSVVIVDEGLRPVQRSHGVRTTSWRPRRPLRRGRTYLWQVTATLRNGTKIVGMSPTSLEARIHITQAPSDQAR